MTAPQYKTFTPIPFSTHSKQTLYKTHIMTTSISGPKIVHIQTRYVETDAMNFRDVVQRLTGKNSSTTDTLGVSNYDAVSVSAKPRKEDAIDGKIKNCATSSMLLMNVSFKDFDLLLSDLPPMEDLLML
ncbi:hypothetical protein Fmac_004664 [Flemingia macrophylla]|uniref:VQ domain-containing protein n=1 Tax=Flemingia macrophylla TaxID=520843 RepID=A0ABD1N5Q9_9FABA